MGLLDKFRSQPRWKHANPAVRTAAVEELPLDQQDVLLSIAREDRDAGVRLAALRKVISPGAIASIAREDADARVREEGASLLLDLATGAVEGTEADSRAALEGLSEPRHVITVAKTASSAAVARAALDRVEDGASLGSVARRSVHAAVRLEALGRVSDPRELVAVALRTEFKDVALAAVERIDDRSRLEEVALHARNKSAAKRARARLRAIDEAAAAAPTVAAPEPDPVDREDEARRRAAGAACERLEAVAAGFVEDGEAAISESERSWRLAGGDELADLAPRFAAARAAAREALERSVQDRAERAAAVQAMAAAVAARRALCEQIDGIAGDETEARLGEMRESWSGLAPLADAAEAERWRERFEAACAAADQRRRAAVEHHERRQKAAAICDAIARLADQGAPPPARGEWQALRRAWNGAEMSQHHTTITLLSTYDLGTDTYGFTWSAYQGLTVSDYFLYGIDINNNVTQIATVPGNVYMYNYVNPNTSYVKYFVGFETPDCNGSKANVIVKSNWVQSVVTYIDSPESFDFAVFPNPVNEKLKIRTSLQNYEIEIINVFGQVLLKEKNANKINVDAFAPGTYILKISGDNFTRQERIIVY